MYRWRGGGWWASCWLATKCVTSFSDFELKRLVSQIDSDAFTCVCVCVDLWNWTNTTMIDIEGLTWANGIHEIRASSNFIFFSLSSPACDLMRAANRTLSVKQRARIRSVVTLWMWCVLPPWWTYIYLWSHLCVQHTSSLLNMESISHEHIHKQTAI